MSTTKPTILIVHGAWHKPSAYDKLTQALRSAGYEVHNPQLPSVDGSSPATGDLITDTALIRSTAEKLIEAGHTIVALLHSYGGQVGSNALYGFGSETRAKMGLKGGVSHLIYLCAFMLPEGWSTYAQAEAMGIGEDLENQLKLEFRDEGNCTMADPRGQLINGLEKNDDDDEAAAAYIAKLGPWSMKCMMQPLTHCAWKEIPATYIHTTRDKTVGLLGQQQMVERVKAEGGLKNLAIVTLDTDHCPHFTATEEVLGVVNKMTGAI